MITLLFTFLLVARAEEDLPRGPSFGNESYYDWLMKTTVERIIKYGGNTGGNCDLLRIPKPATELEVCNERYSEFFKKGEAYSVGANKGVIDIRLSFGYGDNAGEDKAVSVSDHYEKIEWIKTLTTPCQSARVANCGFQRDPDDIEILRKSLVGPDGLPKLVVLRITHSSYSTIDSLNRTSNGPGRLTSTEEQKRQSLRAEDNFLSGLKTADAVIYVGHSRDGGGPDFWPPKLVSDSHTDYDWYQAQKPGKQLMLQALKGGAPNKPVFLGLFSCYSNRHFAKAVHAASPETALVTTNRIAGFGEDSSGAFTFLNSILKGSCQSEIERQLEIHNARAFEPKNERLFKVENFYRQ